MDEETRLECLNSLKSEFRELLSFHGQSFTEIDAKAKYWLTLTLPSFVGLLGYLLSEGLDVSALLLMPSIALATCLFIANYFFSSVLVSRSVESGFLAPADRNVSGIKWYLESSENWAELAEDQVAELLQAIKKNEVANKQKSAHLMRGEISLLRGAPTSICLAACAAFLYGATGPSGLAATAGGVVACGATISTSIVAGAVIAALTVAAFLAARHITTKTT